MSANPRRDDYRVQPRSTAYLAGQMLGWLLVGIAASMLLFVLAALVAVVLWVGGAL